MLCQEATQLASLDTSGCLSPGQRLCRSQHLPAYLAQRGHRRCQPTCSMPGALGRALLSPRGPCGMAILRKGQPQGPRWPHDQCWCCQHNPLLVNTDHGSEDKLSPINKIEVDTEHIRMSLLQGACKMCLFNRTNNISYHWLSGDSGPAPLRSTSRTSSQWILTTTQGGRCGCTLHSTGWETEVRRPSNLTHNTVSGRVQVGFESVPILKTLTPHCLSTSPRQPIPLKKNTQKNIVANRICFCAYKLTLKASNSTLPRGW